MSGFNLDGINDIIKAQLPEQVGKVLRDRLAQAELAEQDLAAAKKTIAKQEAVISDASDQVVALRTKLGDLDSWEDNLSTREAVLTRNERNLAIKELELKLEAQGTIASAYYQFTMGLVRNTEYKRTIAGGGTAEYPAQAVDPIKGVYVATPARTEVQDRIESTEAV